jgi:hypothetical protein
LLNARIDFRIADLAARGAINFIERVEHLAARGTVEAGGFSDTKRDRPGCEISRPDAMAAETRAPSREKSGWSLSSPSLRDEHDERGQILILAADAVAEPRTDARPPGCSLPVWMKVIAGS